MVANCPILNHTTKNNRRPETRTSCSFRAFGHPPVYPRKPLLISREQAGLSSNPQSRNLPLGNQGFAGEHRIQGADGLLASC